MTRPPPPSASEIAARRPAPPVSFGEGIDPAGGVVLTLRPEPPGTDPLGRDPALRLRGALRVLLRRFGWRCVRIAPRPETRPLK